MGRGVSAVTGWLAAAALVVGCGGLGPEAVQGAAVPSWAPTDLALEGPGLFEVSNGERREYTRLGRFSIDPGGFLVDPEGWQVQGFRAGDDGGLAAEPGSLPVGRAQPAVATRTVTIRGNLAADAPLNSAPAFWPQDPSNTSNFRTAIVVHDSLGSPHLLEVYYRKAEPDRWDFHVLTDGAGVTGGVAGVAAELTSGTLAFDAQGRLAELAQAETHFDPLGARPGQRLVFDFGLPTSAGGSGTDGMTQLGGTNGVSTTTFTAQDGLGPSPLSWLSVDGRGRLTGHFADGQVLLVGQVGVALAPNPSALAHTCGAYYAATAASGRPELGPPTSGGRPTVRTGALEALTYPSEPCSGR